MRVILGAVAVALVVAIVFAAHLRTELTQTQNLLATTTTDLVETKQVATTHHREIETKDAMIEDLEVKNGRLETTRQNLEKHNSVAFARLGEARQQNIELAMELQGVVDRFSEQRVAHRQLITDHETLRIDHDVLRRLYGTVTELRLEKDQLYDELEQLRSERQPLILGRYRSGFKCTGSMEPAITCLDEATIRTDFRPEDIVIGATIIYLAPTLTNPDCIEWQPFTPCPRTAHRVIAIEQRSDQRYFLPKGDAVREPDGWIPSAAVVGYIVAIHRNIHPENGELRALVNAAVVAEREAAEACGYGRAGDWCWYTEHSAAWLKAYSVLLCWDFVATFSRHPGDIRWTCDAEGNRTPT